MAQQQSQNHVMLFQLIDAFLEKNKISVNLPTHGELGFLHAHQNGAMLHSYQAFQRHLRATFTLVPRILSLANFSMDQGHPNNLAHTFGNYYKHDAT